MFIIDDIINAIGASNAAAAQERQASQAMGMQRETWNPYMQAGQTSLAQMLGLMQNPSSIANDPSYQFRLAEGQKALERSAAARGGLNSGGFMKGLSRYGQGLASEEYGNQWGRLSGLAGLGSNAAANFSNNMNQLYGAKGDAQARGQMAAWGGGANAVNSLGSMALGGFGPGGWSLANMGRNFFGVPSAPGSATGIPTQASQLGSIASNRSFNPYG